MYYLYCFARFLCSILPRGTVYFISSFLAGVKFYISRRDRQAVIYNLLPLSRDSRQAYSRAKMVFKNFSFYLVDFFSLSKIDKQFIKKYVKIEGRQYLNELVAKKKGVIILSAHIGNYELGASVASLISNGIYTLALSHKDERINKFFDYQRGIFGVKVISTGTTVKNCIQVLKDGGRIAFLGDRIFGSAKGERIKMCGNDAILPKGPAFFALKTDAAILPTVFIRENKYFYRFIFEPAIYVSDGNSPKTLKALIIEYSKILEKYIMKYPQQWYAFQKYWI